MIFFSKSEKKKNPIHVPILKKIHCLECTQYAFLDHSKTLVFRDIIKIEILQVIVWCMLSFCFLRMC